MFCILHSLWHSANGLLAAIGLINMFTEHVCDAINNVFTFTNSVSLSYITQK